MLIRQGFISNSSSSSFIIVPLYSDIHVNIGKSSVIYLQDLLDEMSMEEVVYSNVIDEINEINRTINHEFGNEFVQELVKQRNDYKLKVLNLLPFDTELAIFTYEWDDVNGPYYNWYQELLDVWFDLYNGMYWKTLIRNEKVVNHNND